MSERRSEPGSTSLQARIAELEAELAAVRRTNAVLMDRVEQPVINAGADRFALHKTIAGLQDEVRHRTRELRLSAAHYRALYEQSPDAILTLDPDCRISDCNHTAEALFGRRRQEVQGAAISALLDPASGAALTTLLWSGFTGVGESDVGLADGRRLSFSVARLDDQGWILVLRDVTRSHQLDQELLHARRLASVGRLAASVAHEINNPLSVIQGRVELLEAVPGADPATIQRQLTVIMDHCGRIAGLVRNLQTFAVHRTPRCGWHQVRNICQRAIDQVSGRLRRVHLREEIAPRDLRVRADPDLLVQLLLSLLIQAADQCPSGGELRLEARREDGEIRISIHGDGQGLAEELLAQLRSPYSGRQVDPALGLNLAIAWAIAQDHGGWLTAENRPGGGTSYHVSIPDQAPGEQEIHSERRLRILVVDDDQLLCETVTWLLAHEGHQIATADSAEAALERLRQESFDIVLADYLLPGMNGERLADAIEQGWPELSGRTILTSGLLHTPRRRSPYLQKPFSRAQLLALIQSLVA